MIETIAQRVLPVPPDQVWPLVDDPEAMGRWFGFAERMELVEGSGLGRLQRLHGTWGKRRSQIDQRVVAYQPGRLLTWRHEAERLDGQPAPRFAAETLFTVELQAREGGTLVRMVSRQQPASPLHGLVMRLLARRDTAGAWTAR
jgi:uncharacterized protein YndB with AHSA1/START domain